MKVQSDGGTVDVSTWIMDSGHKIGKKTAAAVAEVIDIALSDGADFSFCIAGPEKVAPPITVFLPFEAYKDEFEGPSFTVTLEALVDEFVECFDVMGDEKNDRVEALATKFRELADRVEIEAKRHSRPRYRVPMGRTIG